MLDKLEMFIALAKAKHFGKAADELGITQPTLSTGIKNLEDRLGVKLVFRGSKFGGLTPEGHSALEWARRIVSDARQLREEMRFTRNGLSGQLRVAVIPTALTWAAQLSARFSEKNPNVRLTLLSRTSIEILSMIENLDVDAGITYLDNEPTGRLSTEPLYRERYMLVCNEASQWYGRESVGWKELEGERLALLTPENQNRRIINGHFRDAGVTPDAWIESDSAVVLVANVERGDWLTILPADIATFLAAGKALKLVPLSGNIRHPSVGLVAPYREPHTPTLQALLKEAAQLAEQCD
ncbi:LysR family transcriptional regulator [Primorskyibacter flagellatus]|uniref:DNA-binding transcriptional regulator, LysR family n=1 Tax=Primorskyibacter flagellatus TaxID=1387277 RepID=A0A1W2DPJ4_9RHOB|nr:LysR family transcriptional regulator [Primorskyibacter flagellatus]SMC98986.1 DNA-binding transcriptional regulator, LysR family [Primorskyibacter flagellatus]